jgi:peroxiredoxin
MSRFRMKAVAAIALAGALVAGLAACSEDPLAAQYRAGDNKGYIAGDLKVTEFDSSNQPKAVAFDGVLDSGEKVSSSDYGGKVTVVNFWYAGCAPCRQEAAQLEKAYQSFSGQDVAFLGVNTYDQAATSRSFAKAHDVTYPSVIDADDKTVTAAFAGIVPLGATPSTVVIGKDGRPTARIIGELPSASILTTLIQDALDGKP